MADALELAFSIADSGITDKTRRLYNTHYRAFVNFLKRLDAVPDSWETCMVVFRAHLMKKGLSLRTIASYMTAVRTRLCLNGVSLHKNQYLMKQMHRAAQHHDVNWIRHPVTKTLLDQVLLRIELVTTSAFETSLFLFIFTLAYHGMFQISELVKSEHILKVRNVLQAENSSWLRCIQHSSKTMRPGDMPQVIDIYPESDPFCPCVMAERYTRLRQRAVPFWG